MEGLLDLCPPGTAGVLLVISGCVLGTAVLLKRKHSPKPRICGRPPPGEVDEDLDERLSELGTAGDIN